MDPSLYPHLMTLWDYMHLNMPLARADCIVGFGCYNDDIALRCAQLYHQGWAPKVLFTGGLGRNTLDLWTVAEADRFAAIARAAGVPEQDILIENRSANSAENILFTRRTLETYGIAAATILGVHKPFMERRLYAALGVYWPEVRPVITSPQLTWEEYLCRSMAQGLTEHKVIEVLVGDFQRMDVYAKRGYQLPQHIPQSAWNAFDTLVSAGYTGELVL